MTKWEEICFCEERERLDNKLNLCHNEFFFLFFLFLWWTGIVNLTDHWRDPSKTFTAHLFWFSFCPFVWLYCMNRRGWGLLKINSFWLFKNLFTIQTSITESRFISEFSLKLFFLNSDFFSHLSEKFRGKKKVRNVKNKSQNFFPYPNPLSCLPTVSLQTH